MQTGKIVHFPIILFGSEYWAGLDGWLRDKVLAERKIDPGDIDLVRVCDEPTAVVEHIRAVTATSS